MVTNKRVLQSRLQRSIVKDVKRDLCDELAALRLPVSDDQAAQVSLDGASGHMLAEQRRLADSLRHAWEDSDDDPLLSEVRDARRRKLQAEQDLRNLIAYAREFMHPRPYRLIDIAEAAGLSVSAVRINYDSDDVALVADLINRESSSS